MLFRLDYKGKIYLTGGREVCTSAVDDAVVNCYCKNDDEAVLYKFIGYEENSKAYRLLDLETSPVIISRDVKFD